MLLWKPHGSLGLEDFLKVTLLECFLGGMKGNGFIWGWEGIRLIIKFQGCRDFKGHLVLCLPVLSLNVRIGGGLFWGEIVGSTVEQSLV